MQDGSLKVTDQFAERKANRTAPFSELDDVEAPFASFALPYD
ncbi:protein of unknown function [Ralstonia solanacearum CFBP2957]|nr:protein of unknown function [Ralstonia solanacearum CFBP2957]